MAGPSVAVLAFPNGGRFEVGICDLLAETTDGIVNAANGHLAHGGGVALAIARAAGPELVREGDQLVRARGFVPVGEAVLTTAGWLPFKGVIHAVGPRRGEGDEEARLARALRAAFDLAQQRGWSSLSFPAVSSGIFAVPVEVCARAYVHAVAAFFAEQPETTLRLLRLCLLAGPLVDAVRGEIVRVEAARS